MSINISPLASKNLTEWKLLWQQYLDFYQVNLADDIIQSTWQKVSESENVKGFGAFVDNRMVGFVHIVIHPNTWNLTECCYLEDLFVLAEYRNQGIGKELIEYIYRYAQEKGYNRVYWVTDKNNHQAQQLYNKLANDSGIIQYRKNF
ncbi:TPA: GNAT family N-acetyltransferase [Mannheimia haemolytica]|uniref:GNAT family N-acetyltransferase n=1 Tax=Mannheimia haemolytica TaxID=75985 RepID=A0A248ZYR2_MANHA|nr:GNAT family N-acetyltransferase [Mannheimia haemolytica]AWW70657.1 N-acetyltransferase [Pasteurellaceae bacterium 12565]AGI31729.1 N-acetyltransferase [Mannheimia haemolytica USDA-ARS-USMARC-183]AGI36165.1 N-acetyltransferase [Mannheimia haemolytica USDA-ARS-USMARC-185]AGK00633.1 putative GNAT family acetyltransferase [Mannheimia haemolytica M42548]AGQ25494.1 GCN5 family acetyltransferase [Mannheimia haemolytica D153]